nr:RING-H2 finger protein ATL66-like [Tanacetum cinerariifolium]
MATQGTQTFHWQEDDDDLDDGNFEIKGSTLIYITILFCIIVIVTFCFFLYSRCIARSRATASSSDVSRTSPTMLLSQPQRGLDAAKINSIPITVHRSMENNETLECSICLGVFDDGVKVKVLPSCCHRYHCECVDKWLITHSTCPICRTTVRVDDSPV